MSILTAYGVSDGPLDTLATPESFAAIGDTATLPAGLSFSPGRVPTNDAARCAIGSLADAHMAQGKCVTI